MTTASPLLLSAFASVFVAEIAGDKTFYSVGAVATRYPWRSVLAGLAPAFAVKMLAAVLLGDLLGRLPSRPVAVVTAATFFVAALLLWREGEEAPRVARATRRDDGAWAAFSTIAFTEWGDPGQLTAAALAASSGAPLVVWIGAVGAMLAKAALALTVGVGLRRYVSARVLRLAACAVCVTMGAASAVQSVITRPPKSVRPAAPAGSPRAPVRVPS